jgi:TIR domain-containing protein
MSHLVAGHVFISYSRRDKDYVHRLVGHLQAQGVPVWFDDSLHAGTSQWVKTIETAIEGSIAVVAVMSGESDGSVWVDRELDLAQELRKPIVPLLLSGRCFMRLRDRQYEDVSDGRLPGPDFTAQLLSPAPEIPRPVTTAAPATAAPAAPAPPAYQHPQPQPPMTQPMAQPGPPMAPPAPPMTPWAHPPQPGFAQPAPPPTAYQPMPMGYPAPAPAPAGYVAVDRAKTWAMQSIYWSVASLCIGLTLPVGWVFAVKALNESRRTQLSANRAYLALGLAALMTIYVIALYTYVILNGVSTPT